MSVFLGHIEVQQNNPGPGRRMMFRVATAMEHIIQDFLAVMNEPQFVSRFDFFPRLSSEQAIIGIVIRHQDRKAGGVPTHKG